jgi:hypothetical protein
MISHSSVEGLGLDYINTPSFYTNVLLSLTNLCGVCVAYGVCLYFRRGLVEAENLEVEDLEGDGQRERGVIKMSGC